MRPLHFRLAGIPIRIDWSFFFLAVFLGAARINDPPALASWIAVVLVSLLVHELGHAVAFIVFGHRPSVVLYAMGGLTGSSTRKPLNPRRQLVVSLAGPLSGLALGLAALYYQRGSPQIPGSLSGVIVADLVFVNIVWTIFNLLPVLPLDGGRGLQALLDIATKGRGLKPALIVSIGVGGVGALSALSRGELWILFLAGLFTLQNIKALGPLLRPDAERELRERLRGSTDAATASEVLQQASEPALQAEAAEQLVRAYLADDRVDDARRALERFPAELPPRTALRAAVAQAGGRGGEAIALLEEAFITEPSDASGAALITGLVTDGQVERAVALLDGQHGEHLGAGAVIAVINGLRLTGQWSRAVDAGAAQWARARHPILGYAIATTAARAGRADDAIAWLGKAIAAGYDNGAQLDADTDLQLLATDPRYTKLRRRLA